MKLHCVFLSVALLSLVLLPRVDASTSGAAIRGKQNLAPASTLAADQERSATARAMMSQLWTRLEIANKLLGGQPADETQLAGKSPPPKTEKGKKDDKKDSNGKPKKGKKVKKTKASPVKVKKPKKKK